VKRIWRRMRSGDRWVAGLLLVLVGLLLWRLAPGPAGERLVAERDGRVIYTAPLDQDRQIELKGPLGTTRLQVAGGQVAVVSSPCPRKVGIGMGKISRGGEWLACVPNHLLVRIEGEAESRHDYDLLSR